MDARWTIVVKDKGNSTESDFRVSAWNVLSRNVKTDLQKYKIDIAATQEIKWRGTGVLDVGNFILLYSCNDSNTFGTDYLINRKYKQAIINF